MFGKKKPKQQKKEFKDLEALIIPEVFYGGQDPYIYKQHEEKKTQEPIKNTEKKKMVKKKAPKPPVNKANRKKFWIFSTIIFLLAVGVVSWYYINDYNKAKARLLAQNQEVNKTTNQNNTNQNNPVTTTTVIIDTTTTSTSDVPTSTPALDNLFLEFPPILTLDTADIDSDSLTDIEEEIFDTDSGTWDTDGDNYYDGQEIYNLYNPKGEAPVKLVDSGLVKEYTNPKVGYRLYYPNVWQKGSVDREESQVLFTASTGDYVEVRFFKKSEGQKFIDWFSLNALGQNYSDLNNFKNRFEEIAMVRKDSLTAYFEDKNYVYTIIYHTKDRGPVKYRHVMQMIYQSFRLQNTTTEVPEQATFPEVDGQNGDEGTLDDFEATSANGVDNSTSTVSQ